MLTLLLSAPTKVHAIENQVNVHVSIIMKVLHVSVLFAPTSVVTLVFASLRNNLPLKQVEHMQPHGMQRNTSDVFVI